MGYYLNYMVYANPQAMAADIDRCTQPGEYVTVTTKLKKDRTAIALLVNMKAWRVATFTPDDVQLRKPVPGDWSPS